MKVLIVLVDKKQENLGGQERRWFRVVSKLMKYEDIDFNFIVNNSSFALSKFTDASAPDCALVIFDNKNCIIDYIKKNINLILISWKYNRIHISNQSIYLIPAILFLKLFCYRKVVSISYNGTSLEVHRSGRLFSYYNKVKFIHRITDKTEILNPRLFDENWLIRSKTSIAPGSFSDPSLYHSTEKKRKIIFAGHFYNGKGISLLKTILQSSFDKEFDIYVYGDSVPDDISSIDFKNWLIDFSKKYSHIHVSHKSNMAGVYSEASVFLSLQSISNYPSQSVIEALYSGCSVLMTNTGDSHMFGESNFIRYISNTDSIEEIWESIHMLHQIAYDHHEDISEISKIRHSPDKYITFIKDFLK